MTEQRRRVNVDRVIELENLNENWFRKEWLNQRMLNLEGTCQQRARYLHGFKSTFPQTAYNLQGGKYQLYSGETE